MHVTIEQGQGGHYIVTKYLDDSSYVLAVKALATYPIAQKWVNPKTLTTRIWVPTV